MTLAYPLHIAREIDRNWQRRSKAAARRGRLAHRHDGGARCLMCRAPSPIAPIASAFLGDGLINHEWQCPSCGHAWITAVRIP